MFPRPSGNSISTIATQSSGVERINELPTMHFGPQDVRVAPSLDFNNRLSAGRVERTVSTMERSIKDAHPEVAWVFIEAQSFNAHRLDVELGVANGGGARLLSLKIFRDRPELAYCRTHAFSGFGMDEAMIDMVVDQRSLGARDGLFDRMELLGNIDTWPTRRDHFHYAAQMTVGTVQPLDDRGMRFMSMFNHTLFLTAISTLYMNPMGG